MNAPLVKVRLAYVQSEGGVPAGESFFRAGTGSASGASPASCSNPTTRQVGFALARDTLVAGGVQVVMSRSAVRSGASDQ